MVRQCKMVSELGFLCEFAVREGVLSVSPDITDTCDHSTTLTIVLLQFCFSCAIMHDAFCCPQGLQRVQSEAKKNMQ